MSNGSWPSASTHSCIRTPFWFVLVQTMLTGTPVPNLSSRFCFGRGSANSSLSSAQTCQAPCFTRLLSSAYSFTSCSQ